MTDRIQLVMEERAKARKQMSTEERQVVALEQIADTLLHLQTSVSLIKAALDFARANPPR